MRRAALHIIMLGVLLTGLPALVLAAPTRESLGVFGDWGAFRAAGEPRCEAIAQPLGKGARPGAYASIATWPARGIRSQVFVRLSRPKRARAPIWTEIGDRRFRLAGSGTAAWALDPAGDAAIIAAMRRGGGMRVTGEAEDGGEISDVYRLKGAPSAIDAAALGCIAPPAVG